MYYDAQRKLAFVMPPRTGSTMFGRLLTEWGVEIHREGKHVKPANAGIADLNLYSIYGFFRDPLERYMSLVRYFKMVIAFPRQRLNTAYFESVGMTAEEIQNLSYEQFIGFATENMIADFYMHPQVDWLANAEILDFKNYTPEILRVARMLDVSKVYVGKLNDSDTSDEVPTQKVIDYVQSYYADDYRLGRERGLLA